MPLPAKIKDLPDEKKSVMLAKAMGLDVGRVVTNPVQVWFGEEEHEFCDVIFYKDEKGYLHETMDFYADHMEVTWMVVNWAFSYPMNDDNSYQFVARLNMLVNFGELIRLPADKAQRIILDKIYFLAAKDGIIKVEE